MSKPTVVFKDWTCNFKFGRYKSGRVQMSLVDVEDGMPICSATLNIEELKYEDPQIIIKDYRENEGLYAVLYTANIVGPIIKGIDIGFETAYLCELLIPQTSTP